MRKSKTGCMPESIATIIAACIFWIKCMTRTILLDGSHMVSCSCRCAE
jgi:hypothetical protein